MTTTTTTTTAVRTGGVTAVVREGQLRDVRVHGWPALEAAYVAVRDTEWGTVPARLEDVQVRTGDDGFEVRFLARHRAPGLDFTWRGRIEGTAGTVVLDLDGVVERPFLANRVGFCLLHPIEVTGHRVRARTLSGPVDAV